IAFGKALQMTNVLRDVAGDLAHGRCYVPARELAAIRLRPVDLREPAPRQRARALYDRLLVRALGHYDDGWNYTLAIPRQTAGPDTFGFSRKNYLGGSRSHCLDC